MKLKTNGRTQVQSKQRVKLHSYTSGFLTSTLAELHTNTKTILVGLHDKIRWHKKLNSVTKIPSCSQLCRITSGRSFYAPITLGLFFTRAWQRMRGHHRSCHPHAVNWLKLIPWEQTGGTKTQEPTALDVSQDEIAKQGGSPSIETCNIQHPRVSGVGDGEFQGAETADGKPARTQHLITKMQRTMFHLQLRGLAKASSVYKEVTANAALSRTATIHQVTISYTLHHIPLFPLLPQIAYRNISKEWNRPRPRKSGKLTLRRVCSWLDGSSPVLPMGSWAQILTRCHSLWTRWRHQILSSTFQPKEWAERSSLLRHWDAPAGR